MVPADNPKMLQKVPNLECDIAILNLEDGVFDKNKGREILTQNLPHIKFGGKIIVRVNSLDECGEQDIKALRRFANIDGFRIPKINNSDDVKKALELCGDKEIHLSIETKEAFSDIKSLKIAPNVTTVYLGILDLFNSLGLSHSLINFENPAIDYILSKFLVDSLSSDFLPISFVYQNHQNLQEFQKWCEKEKTMGLGAKACISPKQVQIANKIFGASCEIQKALEIKELFEASIAQNISGFANEKYGFIDEPIYKNALNVLKNYSV